MGPDQILGLAGQFGPMGLFVGYLVWSGMRADKASGEEKQSRLQYDKDRLDCDRALATSLATLAAVIQGRP